MSKALHEQRMALAAAFRWAAREGWHEAVANHFSLAVNDDGTQFLINPNMRHFSLVRASELLLLDANDQSTLEQTSAPDPTAWGLHGSIHRHCPHARCVLHVHSTYATVLASLEDMVMPPIDQNTAQFYQRTVVDEHYGGMAFQEEGERCAAMLSDPGKKVMVMGNHGVLVLGSSVADAIDRLFYFERSAKNYILALQTGRPLKVLSHEIAEKTAQQWQDDFSVAAEAHFAQINTILDRDEPDFRQ